jgi:hypothetical protein
MVRIILLAFFLIMCCISTVAKSNQSGDTLTQNLSTNEKFRLLLAVGGFKCHLRMGVDSLSNKPRQFYDVIVNGLIKNSLSNYIDTLNLAVADFFFDQDVPRKQLLVVDCRYNKGHVLDTLIMSLLNVDTIVAEHPNLSTKCKADIVSCLTGIFLNKAEIDNNLLTYTVLDRKVARKKKKDRIAQSIAALTYAWVLSNADREGWYVHVRCLKKIRWEPTWLDLNPHIYLPVRQSYGNLTIKDAFHSQIKEIRTQ